MKTGDPELMRAINRYAVLDTIRRYGPMARIDISERTQLSTTTVSAITASLLDDGLISPRHEGDLRNAATRGRPRVMLELAADAARVVGAKIMPNCLVFVLADFRGEVISSLSLPVRVDRQPVAVIADLVEDGIRRCVVDAGLSLNEIDSICVGLPGVVEHRTGRVRSSPIFREADLDFRKELADRLGTEVIIENDANAVAMAHHWFGRARDLDDMVLVSLEQALGLAVLHGGQLFRGARGLSHNLGDLVLENSADGPIRLASQAGERALIPSDHANTRFAEAVRLGRGMAHAPALLATEGDRLVAAVMAAGQAVGTAVANIVTLFAPPRVILVGSTLSLGEPFIAALSEAYHRAVPASLAGVTELVIDNPADEFWARGAAAVALRELYESPWSTTGPAL
ncbi:ROK family transcriptional regulator [Chelativorans sp.]|uniref:ROK family transcriptional regulator n=1 Tax=Chelativorans sp. TaxID=2203393 RepID=UPI0028115AAC|nr:ROK family transcriptional regulator [Chelativorans sp.]